MLSHTLSHRQHSKQCRGCWRRLHVSKISSSYFFFNDPATTEIYTLSLHDALPISRRDHFTRAGELDPGWTATAPGGPSRVQRSEEQTSELQSQFHLVCRLLLEKKNSLSVRTFKIHCRPCRPSFAARRYSCHRNVCT